MISDEMYKIGGAIILKETIKNRIKEYELDLSGSE
jgi:hypothetical protein